MGKEEKDIINRAEKKERIKKLSKSGFKQAIIILLGIIFIIGGSCIYNNNCRDERKIKIVAAGRKNENALSNNVRIHGIVMNRGMSGETVFPIDEVKATDAWQYSDEHYLIYAYDLAEPESIEFTVYKKEKLDIDFIKEVGSGIAEIYVDNVKTEEIDLYENVDWRVWTYSFKFSYIDYYLINALGIFSVLIGLFIIVKYILYKNRERIFGAVKKINIKVLGKAALFGFAVLFLCNIASYVLQPYTTKLLYKDNVKITVEAVSKKNKRALASNARIGRITANVIGDETGIIGELEDDSTGKGEDGIEPMAVDKSTVKLKNGWHYISSDNILYNYENSASAPIDFYIDAVSTFDIRFISEVGSGYVNIYVNDKKAGELDLYSDHEWFYKTYHYQVSPIVRLYYAFDAQIFIFVFSLLLGLLIFAPRENSEKTDKLYEYVKLIALSAAAALIVAVSIVLIQYQSVNEALEWMLGYQGAFLQSFFFISIVSLTLAVLLGRSYASFIVTAGVFITLAVVNSLKMKFRGSPVLFSDILLFSSAASVVKNFDVKISAFTIAMLVLLLIAIIAFVLFERKLLRRASVIYRGVSFVLFVLLGFVFWNNTYVGSEAYETFDIVKYYNTHGLVNAFFNTSAWLKPLDAPEGYSKERLEELGKGLEMIADNDDGDNLKPNIIVIMSESFWDLSRVDELKFNEEFLPNLKRIQEEAVYGEVLTDVFGGGTVQSEFEAITGFSTQYMPGEYIPYQRCIRKDFSSVNSFLKGEGYESEFMHPYLESNYNRNNVYENLNFDKKVWGTDFDESTERVRGYVSDSALFKRIISDYEEHNENSDAPWFNLTVTMQNHGGYWESNIDEGKEIDLDTSAFGEKLDGSIRDMAIGLKYSDIALGELIDYFKNQDEPTIIIMFGDHVSEPCTFETNFFSESESYNQMSNLDKSYFIHKTPFIAWSNYKQVKEDCGVISVNELLPTAFDAYGIKQPKYFKYLNSLKEKYKAAASYICVNPDGSYNYISNMTEEQRKAYDELWLIEYDYIFGENYIKGLFE